VRSRVGARRPSEAKRAQLELARQLGVLLQGRRVASGRTQGQVAASLRVRQSFISKIESGQYTLKLSETPRLARAFGADAEELWAWVRAHDRAVQEARPARPTHAGATQASEVRASHSVASRRAAERADAAPETLAADEKRRLRD
jgi:DNA-binding XRE family transcriptional regulator